MKINAPKVSKMDSKINILFALCIITRVSLIVATYILGNYTRKLNDNLILAVSLLFILISFGFGFNIVRDKKIGFFNSNVYWARSRILHSFLYLMTGILLLTQSKEYAYIFLVLDTTYGILLYMYHYLYK